MNPAELASGIVQAIAAPEDGPDPEVTPLFFNPDTPTTAELRGLALRGRGPEPNVNPVAAKPMLETGLYYPGHSHRAEVILNKQVMSAPGLFQHHVGVEQAEFSEDSCTIVLTQLRASMQAAPMVISQVECRRL
jgi:hypothetical protein